MFNEKSIGIVSAGIGDVKETPPHDLPQKGASRYHAGSVLRMYRSSSIAYRAAMNLIFNRE